MSAKRTTMGRYTPKYPQLDERLLDWFTEQRTKGKFSFYVIAKFNTLHVTSLFTKRGNGQF